jgi:Glycosyl hydrolases family 16
MPHRAARLVARVLRKSRRLLGTPPAKTLRRVRFVGVDAPTPTQLKRWLPVLLGVGALGFGTAIPLGYSASSCHARHGTCDSTTTSTGTTPTTTTATTSTQPSTTTASTATTTTASTATTTTASTATTTTASTATTSSITQSITDGQTLSGSVIWTASPTGSPTSVVFYIDGVSKWSEYFAPYQFNGDPDGVLDTTTLTSDAHTFAVVAKYADGSSTSVTATDTVDNSMSRVVSSSSADPSGQAMPVGDTTVSGQAWHQVFADNFPSNEDVALGSTCGDSTAFPHAANVSTKWTAYPYGWKGTPTWGSYCPELTTSIHDGMMDIWLHSATVNGTMLHLIDAVEPRFSSGGGSQLYGRYVIRYEEPVSFPMFHLSWLLWPDSNVWPGDGEIDFPEGDTNQATTNAFMHYQGATSGGQQDAYTAQTPISGAWHTAVIEWLPSRCTFILDGKTIGNSTSHIPDTSMHYVIQNGGSFGVTTPNNTSQGHIYIDWVAIYARG